MSDIAAISGPPLFWSQGNYLCTALLGVQVGKEAILSKPQGPSQFMGSLAQDFQVYVHMYIYMSHSQYYGS